MSYTKIKFYFFVLFQPVSKYLRMVYSMIRLKNNNPTLKLVGRVQVGNSKFGLYNYLALNSTLVNVTLGDFSYVGAMSFLQNVQVGSFTCIGPSVSIGLGNHPVSEFVSIHPVFYSKAAQSGGITFADKQYFNEYDTTNIGHDVWIGASVIIRGGIKIGNGAVIASGAVVTRDVPPYAIVGGVPSKVIKYRFSEEEIKKLDALKWWDKDVSWLKANFKEMHNIQNIDRLLEIKDEHI